VGSAVYDFATRLALHGQAKGAAVLIDGDETTKAFSASVQIAGAPFYPGAGEIDMARLFAAVDLPPEWKAVLSAAAAGAGGRGGKPTARENLHLTVFFIGETKPDAVPDLIRELETPLSRLAPFSLPFSRLHSQAGRMLWASFADTPAWRLLCGAVRLAAAPFAAKPEPREQTAHVTLARFKHGGAHLAPLCPFTPPGPNLEVAAVDLMRSLLSPLGPSYVREHRFELTGEQAS